MKCDFAKPVAGGIVATALSRRIVAVGRSMRLPTEAEISGNKARQLVETPLQPADLLFVFGTRVDVAERVDETCRLWREGYFRRAIVSGGVTPGSEQSECEIIADRMISRGVPADIILREDRAMNTGE